MPLLSALFVVLWSAGFIGSKLGTTHAPFDTVLLWRSLALTGLLLPWVVTAVRCHPVRDLGRLATVGLLSQGVYLVTVYWAVGLGVSSGTVALIDGVQPLAVAALAGPLLGAVTAARQWLGLGLGLLGVVVVSAADLASPETTAPWWGYPLPLVGMAALVAATFVQRRAPRRTPALQALAVHSAATAVLAAAIALVNGHAAPPTEPGFWLVVAWMVVLATLGGYGLYWVLLERRGVTRVNALMFLVPPVTTAWGAVWFGEPVGPLTVLGLGLALLAVRLAGRGSADESMREQESAPRDHRERTPAGRA